MTSEPRLEVEIDALVLEGFSPGERELFTTAFTRELTRLLQHHGAPSSVVAAGDSGPTAMTAVDGRSFHVAPGLAADAMGTHAAAAVYRGLGGAAQ